MSTLFQHFLSLSVSFLQMFSPCPTDLRKKTLFSAFYSIFALCGKNNACSNGRWSADFRGKGIAFIIGRNNNYFTCALSIKLNAIRSSTSLFGATSAAREQAYFNRNSQWHSNKIWKPFGEKLNSRIAWQNGNSSNLAHTLTRAGTREKIQRAPERKFSFLSGALLSFSVFTSPAPWSRPWSVRLRPASVGWRGHDPALAF